MPERTFPINAEVEIAQQPLLEEVVLEELMDEDDLLGEELEELIIEDFATAGICGVY
jgi:hypothetical protein